MTKITLNYTITRNRQHEDIVMYTPMSDDASYFFYNAKAYTYQSEGSLFLNDKMLHFD